MKLQTLQSLAVATFGVLVSANASLAQAPAPELDPSLDPNVSTRVEDLRLDEIAVRSDARGEPEFPRLSEAVSYRGSTFEPVTVELNDPERLPQNQSSQFNLHLSVEDRE